MVLQRGTSLGRYEIVEPIGKGGMGEVYRARDGKLGREVAIKVLPEEFARDKGRLDRFEREARLLAQLNHTNIATLHGLEEEDGQPFLVMELVEGETLGQRIARGSLPLEEVEPLFIQIAEGLEAAHEKGIIHRDLKPANIKITSDGKIKILDFGLAKAYAPEQDVSAETSQSPTRLRHGFGRGKREQRHRPRHHHGDGFVHEPRAGAG
jgi:serine/threonine protein kinase